MIVRPDQEQLIGEILGLDAEQAEAVVGILIDRHWLCHGIVATGAAMAARWGVELPDALRGMADGRRLGAEFSDYELRVAREEAADDIEDVWDQVDDNVRAELRERLQTTQSSQAAAGLVAMDQANRSVAYVEVLAPR